jgi:NitT/TauT family transport system substrate-binding protein
MEVRKMQRRTGIVGFGQILTVVSLFLGLWVAPSLAAEKVVYRQGWFGSGLYAPWWLAKDAGYYAKRGLEVDVQEGKGGSVAVKLVASKTVTFGDADGNTIMKAVHEGAKIKAIYSFIRRNPSAVIAHGKANIRKAKDLEGRSLAIPPGSSQFLQLPIFFQMAKIDKSKVNVIHMDPRAMVSSVMSLKADSLSSYPASIVPVFEAKDVPTTVVNFADYGVAVVGQNLVGHNDDIKNRPKVVRAFIEATAEAWKVARATPGKAAKAYVKMLPMHQYKIIHRQLVLYQDYLDSKATKGKPHGWEAESAWKLTQDIGLKAGVIKKKMPLNAYYTNRFIPKK